jgi:hypothetical protein
MITLTDLCRELKNWFEMSRYSGLFRITDGVIDLSDLVTDGSLQDGQYFRIVGSVFNDGVYQYPASDLDDETFSGAVYAMAVPKEVLTLLNDINAWLEQYSAELQKPYASESFGGYSYSLKGGLTDAASSGVDAYKAVFASRLNKWRKIR